MATATNSATTTIPTISPRDLEAKRQAGQTVELIDVREPFEFQELRCSFARNVPLSQLDPAKVMQSRQLPPSEPLYVICRSGSRGRQACEKFQAAGFTNVINVEGGTLGWEQCGLEVQRGRKVMSLERQVRIAAGLMVLVGVALGFFVHPGFLGIAAFVGAGLVFAGVTDTCGIALLLARMPWNRVCTSAVLLLIPGLLWAAEHTRDSLDTVKKALADNKAVLIDVREQSEWDDGHLQDARLLPLSVLGKGLSAEILGKVAPKDKVLYLHCASGNRCLKAADLLKKQGYDVRPLKSGYADLLKAGFKPAK
ncbi:MAG: rhodanese-like domain-containing protein [Gemmataceae bacterium]